MQSFQDVQKFNYRTRLALSQTLRESQHNFGDYKWSCRSTDFNGWLVCDGRQLLIETYTGLYDVIKLNFTQFSPVNPVTFSIPNSQGMVFGCLGNYYDSQGNPQTRTLGQTDGALDHAITEGELTAHSHTGATNMAGAHGHSTNDPGHSHSQHTIINGTTGSAGVPLACSDSSQPAMQGVNNIESSTTGISIGLASDHLHNFVTDQDGGGAAMSLMQPTLFGGTLFIFAGV